MAVLGYDKLQKQLEELAKIDTRFAAIKMAEKVYDRSQNLVPVDTGDLKDSGKVIEAGEGAQVIYDAGHALHVEFGTVKMKAQPYLRPAYEAEQRELVETAAKEIEAAIKESIR
jgi:HK97 gp10 family phage protein